MPYEPRQESAFTAAVRSVRSGQAARIGAGDLTSQLTVPERLGLLDGDQGFWAGILGWALFGYNHAPVVAGAIPRLGVPGLRFTDGPRGIALGRSTSFPVPMARGATWDPDLEERVGLAMGLEARAQGANLVGAPCVNLLRHPAWGRAQETYGEDPVHVGAMGAALVRGIRRNAMACVKHFALNSIEDSRFRVDVTVEEDVLHEVFLPHFRQAIAAGAAAVMSAYNRVNGRWCGDNPDLLTAILREEWGFQGVVVSDFVFGLRDPVGSLRAGLDVELPFRQQRATALTAALTSGELNLQCVDRAARRSLSVQLESHAVMEVKNPAPDVVANADHRALAREVAVRSMVLLRNEAVGGGPVLPLRAPSLGRVAVIGRLAASANLGDRGSSSVHPPVTCSLLDGLREALTVVHDDGSDPHRAAMVAASCDAAVVVAGYRASEEGESMIPADADAFRLLPAPASSLAAAYGLQTLVGGLRRRGLRRGGDRQDLGLPTSDLEAISAVAQANRRTVVVLIAGSAVLMETWRQQVPAILLAWYPGMEGGRALAEVLTGSSEPGGRLPFVIPRSASLLPAFDSEAQAIEYDRWHGYRRLDRDGEAPAFPYGFGLGYTRFQLRDLRVLGREAHVTVHNSGPRRGATVVQVYAEAEVPGDRPRTQLVGFSRVELPAGGIDEIDIPWSDGPLSRRDSATRTWAVIPGSYRLVVGQYLGDPDAVSAPFEVGKAHP